MENLEILKGIVSDETYARLESETKDSPIKLADLHSGEYVSKAKYSGLETELENTKTALANKTADYDTLSEKAGDNQSLKDEIEKMKTAHQTEISNLNAAHQKTEKSDKVRAAIANYHPKDVNDIMPHIDMEKITVDGDKLTGFTEQIEPLKESKGYLFDNGSERRRNGLEHGGDLPDDDALYAAFGIKKKKE